MSSIILILASISLSLIIAHFLFKKFNVFRKGKEQSSTLSFLSEKDTIKYVSEKAHLNDIEKEQLKMLLELVSGSRLYQSFEDETIAKKWLVSCRNALTRSTQLDQGTMEELEYAAYEIYRKINNIRIISHPTIKITGDINIGQPLDIQISEKTTISGKFADFNFNSISITISAPDYIAIKSLKLLQKKISISFWKVMDARYQFFTTIIAINKNIAINKKENITLILSNPKQIKCIQIREFPRQVVEIPIKFRQAILSVDENTGAQQESFGAILFGIINDIGPWGCSIISHSFIPENTVLIIEIPLFDQIFPIKGMICGISSYREVYTLHVKFVKETPKRTVLQIYHYIFAKQL